MMYYPPEWAPHEATWLAWPHNRSDWPGKLRTVAWVYGEMIRHIAAGELVHLLVNDAATRERARRVLAAAHVPLANVQFHVWRTNRGWMRDCGPIFVQQNDGQRVVLDFRFNAWARYPAWQQDNAVPQRVARLLGVPRSVPQGPGGVPVLEGGAIDGNGAGTLLTTEECLLDERVQVRNPGYTAADYEDLFQACMGVRQTLWLGRGIVGDDTHGHVDDVCRFIRPDTVLLMAEQNPQDANYRSLAENRERLAGVRLANGRRLQVVELPMPAPLYHRGARLPASYANFYIGNAAVLVPTFNDPNDRHALGIVGDLVTDRPVIGIHAVDLVLGLGTLHCLTQQQPCAQASP
jgi:agmatine deiminase